MSLAFIASFARSLLVVSAALFLVGLGAARLLSPPPLELFRTSLFEMRVLPDWRCDQVGGEFVCEVGTERPSNAIGIIAMKFRGPQDNLRVYETYLREAKQWTTPDGEDKTSVVRYTRRERIAGHEWVSSLHYESEVPGFFTWYLASVTSYAGIVVTFSAAKTALEPRSAEFRRMLDSLVVYQSAGYE